MDGMPGMDGMDGMDGMPSSFGGKDFEHMGGDEDDLDEEEEEQLRKFQEVVVLNCFVICWLLLLLDFAILFIYKTPVYSLYRCAFDL